MFKIKIVKYICFFWIFFYPSFAFVQTNNQKLAEHYYSEQQYEKALDYYSKLYNQSFTKFNFNRYIDCLIKTGDLRLAEKTLKKAVSKNQGNIYYSIALASFYEDDNQNDKANKIYIKLIDELKPNASSVIGLYNSFKAKGKSDLSFQTLEKGRKLLKKGYPLNFQFAEYYGSIGKTKEMIDEYLGMIDYHRSHITTVKRVLGSQIDFSDEESKEYDLLRVALIERTQKKPDDINYSDLLTWLFIQRKNFSAALIHIKALDKRSKSNGKNAYNFALICVENKDFGTARGAFQSVLDLGKETPYYTKCQKGLLNLNFLEVTSNRNFSKIELNSIIEEYKNVLKQYSEVEVILPLILELTEIQAFYANKEDEALQILNEALLIPGISKKDLAKVKMALADVHVLHGDIWEASLLYMQVDNTFKFEPIGHEAKFKNARIFYYDGEFEFAQSQLDVLKQSTTKLIANDAMKLSLFIIDNYGLDSNYIAMSLFSKADLLIEQHRYKEAFNLFDSIVKEYPGHSLGDEILFKKSYSYQLRGQWSKAILSLEELMEFYSDNILADDALFQLGNIYENHLLDNQKAAEYYRRILFDYKGSLYTSEVRKRFKAIRSIENQNYEEQN